MDSDTFSASTHAAAAEIISELYNFADLPRSRVNEIRNMFETFLKSPSVTVLSEQIIARLQHLGKSQDNLEAYQSMFATLQDPFESFKNEDQCISFFERTGTYLPAIEISVDIDKKGTNDEQSEDELPEKVSYQLFPLTKMLTKFYGIPGIFQATLDYAKQLEKEEIISNYTQGDFWKSRKLLFDDKIVFPILLYQDDFENNNPLGSHRGSLGKVGGVYVTQPSLPPNLVSKVENILPLTLYNAADESRVPLRKLFSGAVAEIQFLENEGITVDTESGPVKVYFSLGGVIGDNLAMHTILGFVKSFSASHPCILCLTHYADLNKIFNESSCELRTPENHRQHLIQSQPRLTGVTSLSVLHDLPQLSTIDLLTVDIMHDIAEGIWEYDLGLVLHVFIVTNKYFSLDDLNGRIKTFHYGKDEGRNKPRQISQGQISKKYIKMSASEAFCFLKNIGVMIGHLVPEGNEHWRLIILLKDIYDIVVSPFVHKGIPDVLGSLVEEYLVLRTELFPGLMKPKHHTLVHYPSVMKRMGPLGGLSTIRCESKNKEFKTTSQVSISRGNLCKSLAIKAQLRFSHRLRSGIKLEDELYQKGNSKECCVYELPNVHAYDPLIPLSVAERVQVLDSIVFRNKTISGDTVLAIPSESETEFFAVHLIMEKSHKLYVIVKEVTKNTLYDEHYNAYRLHNDAINLSHAWHCFDPERLESCFVTRVVANNGRKYIPKRWI